METSGGREIPIGGRNVGNYNPNVNVPQFPYGGYSNVTNPNLGGFTGGMGGIGGGLGGIGGGMGGFTGGLGGFGGIPNVGMDPSSLYGQNVPFTQMDPTQMLRRTPRVGGYDLPFGYSQSTGFNPLTCPPLGGGLPSSPFVNPSLFSEFGGFPSLGGYGVPNFGIPSYGGMGGIFGGGLGLPPTFGGFPSMGGLPSGGFPFGGFPSMGGLPSGGFGFPGFGVPTFGGFPSMGGFGVPLGRDIDQMNWKRGNIANKLWIPRTNVLDEGDNLKVEVELPGVKPEDIRVFVRENILVISPAKPIPQIPQEKGLPLQHESHFGYFWRQLPLPETVDAKKVTAEHEDGILKITIPKSSEATGQKVNVNKK